MELSSRLTMFADDTRLSKGIKSEEDIRTLQSELDNVFKWQRAKNMEFNGDKFQHLPHGRIFRSNRELPRGQYFDNVQNPIKIESTVRDLGIEVSASTDFIEHINVTCKRARSKVAWIYRNFYSRDVQFLSFMWRNFVQPILDYGCQLWAPNRQN